jgi:hypothetical protein
VAVVVHHFHCTSLSGNGRISVLMYEFMSGHGHI